MLLSFLVGVIFVLGGLFTGAVVYFGSTFELGQASVVPWGGYLTALAAVGIGVAIIVFR